MKEDMRMKKYEITVIETCQKKYVIEAHNVDEAEELFAAWVDSHQEWVADDLLDCSCGWEYTDPVRTKEGYVDIPYRELIENVQKSN